MLHLNQEKSGINCQVFWFLLQLLQVFDLAREEKRHCIPISWATVKAAWRPSSSITAQLRSGEHMVPTSAIPRVSHEWCPHKSCPGERKKSLKSIYIQKEPPCRATCSLQMSTLGYVYGITCSALETFQRQTNSIDSSKLLWVPEAQKGLNYVLKDVIRLWLVHYNSSRSLNKAVLCICRHICHGSLSHTVTLRKALIFWPKFLLNLSEAKSNNLFSITGANCNHLFMAEYKFPSNLGKKLNFNL